MECIHLGYDDKSKVYRLYSPTHHKIVLNKNVVFDEEKIIFFHINKKEQLEKEVILFSHGRIEQLGKTKEQLWWVKNQPRGEKKDLGRIDDLGVAKKYLGIKKELSQAVDVDEVFERKERPRNLIYEDTCILSRQYPTKECWPSTKLWDHVLYGVGSELEPTIYEEVVTDKEW